MGKLHFKNAHTMYIIPYSRKTWRWLKFGDLAICAMIANLKFANISLLQWNPSKTDTIGTKNFVRYKGVSFTEGLFKPMEIQSGQSQVSVLSRVSTVEGCPLSGVPLYMNIYTYDNTVPYRTANIIFWRLWTKPLNLKTANISGYTL